MNKHDNFDFKTIKSGFVAILGRPNVGKSTLLNRLIGEKLAITTPKPQTTRDRILGVLHLPNAQIAFIDTPGYHKAKKHLNQYMVRQASSTIKDVDIVIIMIDASDSWDEFSDPWGAYTLIKKSYQSKKPVILTINKVDIVNPKEKLLPIMEKWAELEGVTAIVPISASEGDGIERLIQEIIKLIPNGPAYYPEGMITDRPDSWLISEIIREKLMLSLREEIPYSTAVVVEQLKYTVKGVIINAVIYVERQSQKGIVIGAKGSMIKQIGQQARKELEAHFKDTVHLFLDVKVKKDWSSKISGIKHMGYEE